MFDVVTGFNAFQFASEPVAVLREARRVTTPTGRLAIAFWGRAEACDLATVAAAIGPFLPPPPPGDAGPFAFALPGRIEALLEEAGLTQLKDGQVSCPFIFNDLSTALRAITSAGAFVAAAERAGDDAVRHAVAGALGPFRTGAGGYYLRNSFRYVVAAT
jgi:hypothetical protein